MIASTESRQDYHVILLSAICVLYGNKTPFVSVYISSPAKCCAYDVWPIHSEDQQMMLTRVVGQVPLLSTLLNL